MIAPAQQPSPKSIFCWRILAVFAVSFSDSGPQRYLFFRNISSLRMATPLEAADHAATPRNQVEEHHPLRGQLYDQVLHQLQSAIEILDGLDAPGHIAAHVDLAIHQLQDVIDSEAAGGRLDQIERKAAPQ
jgi:hypothetical protein